MARKVSANPHALTCSHSCFLPPVLRLLVGMTVAVAAAGVPAVRAAAPATPVTTGAGETSAARRPITPVDLYRVRRVGDPEISPDGRLAAVTVGTPSLERNGVTSDIWLVELGSGETRRLTFGSGDNLSNHSPRWSPRGDRIAFISDRGGVPNLFVLPIDGGEARRLTSSETGLSSPVWSSDGRFILCSSRVPLEGADSRSGAGSEGAIEEDLPECKARVVDRLLFRQWDRWLGDDRNHLLLVTVADGSIRDITPGDVENPPVSLSSGHDLDISPDGSEVCLVRNDDPGSARSTNHDLYIVDLGSGETRRITDNPALDREPHYSPDGRYIAYRAMSQPGYEADREVLMIYDRASGAHRSLTGSLDRSVREIVWAPDGKALYFSARENGRSNIFKVSLGSGEETGMTRVLEGGYSTAPAISPDGTRMLVNRSFNNRPAELEMLELGTGRISRLTHFNDELVAELELPELEDFRFAGADGVEVHGFIQRPPGFDPERSYPVVLVVHGGPQNMWADRFMTSWFTFPLVSAPGYVAVMINPRGSTGYGQSFRAQVSRDYGGRAIEDLLKGLDYAIATFDFIDPERQAVIGGSFGGYVVNWLIGHTDRFACVVSHAGLYNLTSFFGATEEIWFPAWDMGTSPWEEPDLYARWSPHHYAAAFSTPTLVTHGERDYRVPFAESLQLFTALQVQGVPSRLVVLPESGHVVTAPQANVRWWREIYRWLGEHLAERQQ